MAKKIKREKSTEIELAAPTVVAHAQFTEEQIVERRSAYNKLVRTSKLREVKLISAGYYIKPAYHMTSSEDHRRSVGAALLNVSHDTSTGLVIAEIEWHATISHSRKTLAKVETRYIIIYHAPEDTAEDILRIYLNSIGMATIYPYFRTLCAQFDWAGGLSLPPLPVRQFTPQL